MPPVWERSLSPLMEQMASIRGLLELPEERLAARREAVSRWSPAEHLDHVMKVFASVLQIVSAADRKELPRRINWAGRLVLLTGRIPRG